MLALRSGKHPGCMIVVTGDFKMSADIRGRVAAGRAAEEISACLQCSGAGSTRYMEDNVVGSEP